MKKQTSPRWLQLLLATIATIVLLGAFNSTLAQPGIGAEFAARDPRTCKDKTQPRSGALSAEQAKEYLICDTEGLVNQLYLIDEVTVQVAPGRRYNPNEDINFPDIDLKFLIYPIRGSYKSYSCSRIDLERSNLKRNCMIYDEPHAKGACYKDSFGDWRCGMTDVSTGQFTEYNVAPPGGAKQPNAPAEKRPGQNKTSPKNNEQPRENKTDAGEKDADGYPKPDFSEMEKWFEIVKYEYKPLEQKLYVYLKLKVENGPTEFRMEFYDNDGIALQNKYNPVSAFGGMPGYKDAAVGETVKVYVHTPNEKLLEQVVKAKVVRVPQPG